MLNTRECRFLIIIAKMNDSLVISSLVHLQLSKLIQMNLNLESVFRIFRAPMTNVTTEDAFEISDTSSKLIVISDMRIVLYNIFYQFRIQTFNLRTRNFKFLTSIALFSFKNILMRDGNSLSSLKLVMRSFASLLVNNSRKNHLYFD